MTARVLAFTLVPWSVSVLVASAQGAPGERDAAVLSLQASLGADNSGATPVDAGIKSDLRASLKYDSTPGSRVIWFLSGDTSVSRFDTVNAFEVVGHTVGGGVSVSVDRRTRVAVTGTFGYLPSYALALAPAAVTNPFAANAALVLADIAQVPADAG